MISMFYKIIRSFINKDDAQSSALSTIKNDDHFRYGNSSELIINNMPGIITNLCNVESYGVINNGIYFDFNVVFGNEKVKPGDRVIVCAERDNKFCGFIANSVILDSENWESEKIEPDTDINLNSYLSVENFNSDDLEIVEGCVTEFHESFGILDKKYKFFLTDCVPDLPGHFNPNIGDIIVGSLVSCKLEERVIEWKPKTTKKIEGTVVSREFDWGVINEDIVFFVNSCHCDFTLVCGQKIWVNIVESQHPPFFTWRAFSLMPYSAESNCISKPNIPESENLYIDGTSNFNDVILGDSKNIQLSLQNNNDAPLNLSNAYFQKQQKNSPFIIDTISHRHIESHSKIVIKISCKAESIGHDNDLLICEFEDFVLSREVIINVIDPTQGILNPVTPYSRKTYSKSNVLENYNAKVVIPGQSKFNPKANFEGFSPNYGIPNKLRDAVQTNDEEIFLQTASILMEDLNMNNYCIRFSCLLHLEEIQMGFDMHQFEMSEKVLQRRGEFLVLEVPGLAEGRPSLLIGDKAMLWLPNQISNIVYEGFIHEVHQNDIFLKFHKDFQNSYNGVTFNISFQFNRSNFRRQHQCLRHVYNSARFLLFPRYLKLQKPLIKVFNESNKSFNRPQYRKNINWKNSCLNSQQKLAVQHIMESNSRPLPYIIFGPPGTGKTITLVEAVLQIYEAFENSRILICTPTNSAADLFTQRLLESKDIKSCELVRLNSYQRNVDSIPEFIKPYCQDKDKILSVIEFPIIISTCSTAGILYTTKMPNDHFTHVFVDEACQLTEPEIMIPIGIISIHTNGSLIMAGDHKQLGPVLQSSLAKTYGLDISYFERIMELPLYAHNPSQYESHYGYNPQLLTMLIHCYRMHPAILWSPSSFFYNSQLECSVPQERHTLLSDLDILPRKNFPIVFHGVQGTEEREENSPSWFNAVEVVEVTNYLRRLYANGLNPNDIGIITPYRKQVEKLRLFINVCSLESCKIGSVEEFQGQERRVVIISTVRSHSNYIESDVIHNLGFLSNPKRFNVAITRAMELLIVVGNPSVLSQDEHWKSFIHYCHMNGGYIGWTP